MDVTNPGLVSVEAETYGNPDPNSGTAWWEPYDTGSLEEPADDGRPLPPDGGVNAETFPTPEDVVVSDPVPGAPVGHDYPPAATEVVVADQSLGLGSMVPVNPLDLSAGYRFLSPAENIVVDSDLSVRTNITETTAVLLTVAAVYDADNLFSAPGPNTTRYYLVVTPLLTTDPISKISVLGRQVVFAEDALTVADRGAARFVTGSGTNYVVIDRDDPTDDDGTVPQLAAPQVGDTLWLDVTRRGSEDTRQSDYTEVDVFILPDPPAFVPNAPQDAPFLGNFEPQPGDPYIGSGVRVPPTVVDALVADQSLVVGLPSNVFV